MKLYLNIDADSIIYEAAFSAQTSEKGVVIEVRDEYAAFCALDQICKVILNYFREIYKDIEDTWFITHNDITHNFRYQIDNTYKANRKGFVKPIHYQACRERLIKKYNVIIADGEEAEDLAAVWHMIIEAAKDGTTVDIHSILVGIDKDLNNVPGDHFNWRKIDKGVVHISAMEAMNHFYIQLLTGDSTDNIKGIKGVGIKTAEKELFKDLRTGDTYSEFTLWNKVKSIYKQRSPETTEDEIIKRGQLLWIRHYKDQIWSPPQ